MLQCKEGDGYLSVGDYNNAEESYTNVIKLYGKGEYSCVNAYYGRGLSYYNRGKWGKAIDDFENAVSDYRCSSVVREHCTKLLDDARKCREQEIQEQNVFWGTLFATAAVVATSAIMANEQGGTSPNTGNVGAGSAGEDYSDVEEPAETGNSASTSKSKSKCGVCGGKGATISMWRILASTKDRIAKNAERMLLVVTITVLVCIVAEPVIDNMASGNVKFLLQKFN